MPRRKPNQLKEEAKEKREIQMRLMQIRLRVDEHIYKNNPITPDIAEGYFQEVSALRLRCYQDRRLLQVIEKLTREMRQIVLEKTEYRISVTGTAAQLRSNGCCTITESRGFIDLCVDDDITEKENKDPANNDIAEIPRAVSGISVRDIESQSILNNNEYNIGHENYSCGQGFEGYGKNATVPYEKNNTLITTLDLQSQIENRCTNTEKVNNVFLPAQNNKYATSTSSLNTTLKHSNNIENPDKNYYNTDAISSISICDIESQSILNINEYNIGLENYSCGQAFEEYEKIYIVPYEKNKTKTTLDLQSLIENQATNTEKANNIFLPAQKDTSYKSSVNTTLKDSYNIETADKNNYNTDTVVNKRKRVKKDAFNSNEDTIINKSDRIVEANKTSNKKAVTKKGKFKPPSKNNANIKEKKVNKHLSTSNTKNEMKTVSKEPKNAKDKVKTIPQDMNEAMLNTQTNNFGIKSKIESKKTTENVTNEIDLSWVENIKYVRQIDKEEYNNNMNITETFWNTCEFPSDWNGSEFNY